MSIYSSKMNCKQKSNLSLQPDGGDWKAYVYALNLVQLGRCSTGLLAILSSAYDPNLGGQYRRI